MNDKHSYLTFVEFDKESVQELIDDLNKQYFDEAWFSFSDSVLPNVYLILVDYKGKPSYEKARIYYGFIAGWKARAGLK